MSLDHPADIISSPSSHDPAARSISDFAISVWTVQRRDTELDTATDISPWRGRFEAAELTRQIGPAGCDWDHRARIWKNRRATNLSQRRTPSMTGRGCEPSVQLLYEEFFTPYLHSSRSRLVPHNGTGADVTEAQGVSVSG